MSAAWINYGKSWAQFYDREGDNLAKPGTMIRFVLESRYGFPDREVEYLIGHVNNLGGLCDDCHIEHDAIIMAYAVVLELKVDEDGAI